MFALPGLSARPRQRGGRCDVAALCVVRLGRHGRPGYSGTQVQAILIARCSRLTAPATTAPMGRRSSRSMRAGRPLRTNLDSPTGRSRHDCFPMVKGAVSRVSAGTLAARPERKPDRGLARCRIAMNALVSGLRRPEPCTGHGICSGQPPATPRRDQGGPS
jgi:hypothetical protein